MPTLTWRAPMSYHSAGDEAAFFTWLQSIPGVVRVEGRGRELLIHLRSRRLSKTAVRELVALYMRYGGNMPELEPFATPVQDVLWLACSDRKQQSRTSDV